MGDPGMSSRPALAPLRSRPFRLLFGGRLADNLANAVAPIALAFAVLDLGGSPTVLGLVLAARTLPMVLLVLFGGVIADRLPRHLVLVVANAVSAGTQALVAVLLLTGTADLWHLAAIEAVNGMSSAFMMPASSGLTPETVPPDQLQPANALLRLGHNFSFVTGSAAGGALVAISGSGWAFAVDAVLFALGAVLLGRIRLPRSARLDPTLSWLTCARAGRSSAAGPGCGSSSCSSRSSTRQPPVPPARWDPSSLTRPSVERRGAGCSPR